MNQKQWMNHRSAIWMMVALAAVLAMVLLGGGSHPASEEKRIGEVLSRIAGAGKVEVALFYGKNASGQENAAPVGAVVVAQGAENIEVRLNLIRAVQTLLNLPQTAVDVFAMGK